MFLVRGYELNHTFLNYPLTFYKNNTLVLISVPDNIKVWPHGGMVDTSEINNFLYCMIYENVISTCGPYLGKDGRYRITLNFKDGTKKGMSYPKYLMEMHLERYLEDNETVDHIDENPLNNDLSNLRVLDRQEHCSNDCIRNHPITVNCTYCGKSFTIDGNKINSRNRKDRHQSGYFCSRQCSGKYGKEIQLHLREHEQKEKIVASKYKLHQYE